jgi:hypothetical protein
MTGNPWWVEEVGVRHDDGPQVLKVHEAKTLLMDILNYYSDDIPDVPDVPSVLAKNEWLPMKCPFHEDTHASAGVNLYSLRFKCHACDARGDAIDLVMREECLNFKEALRWISVRWKPSKFYGASPEHRTSNGSEEED